MKQGCRELLPGEACAPCPWLDWCTLPTLPFPSRLVFLLQSLRANIIGRVGIYQTAPDTNRVTHRYPAHAGQSGQQGLFRMQQLASHQNHHHISTGPEFFAHSAHTLGPQAAHLKGSLGIRSQQARTWCNLGLFPEPCHCPIDAWEAFPSCY